MPNDEAQTGPAKARAAAEHQLLVGGDRREATAHFQCLGQVQKSVGAAAARIGVALDAAEGQQPGDSERKTRNGNMKDSVGLPSWAISSKQSYSHGGADVRGRADRMPRRTVTVSRRGAMGDLRPGWRADAEWGWIAEVSWP